MVPSETRNAEVRTADALLEMDFKASIANMNGECCWLVAGIYI